MLQALSSLQEAARILENVATSESTVHLLNDLKSRSRLAENYLMCKQEKDVNAAEKMINDLLAVPGVEVSEGPPFISI